MTYDEWNKRDYLSISIYSAINPVAKGDEGLDALLEVFEKSGGFLKPDKLSGKRFNYSRARARQLLAKKTDEHSRRLGLTRLANPEVDGLLCLDEGFQANFEFTAWVKYLSFFREPGQQEERAKVVVSFIRALASFLPLTYGLCHPMGDTLFEEDPHLGFRCAPRSVHASYWVNVYGRELVEAVGRERVLKVPCHHLEELPCGGVLWLSRPTPADFDSEEARQAQARALVHLKPELELEAVLAKLRERSEAFQPVEARFHPEMAPLLEQFAAYDERMGRTNRHLRMRRFNAWEPSPLSEALPLAEAPATDVENPEASVDHYEERLAEGLIASLNKDIPRLLENSAAALPEVDYYVWLNHWAGTHSKNTEAYVSVLGAYLGACMVYYLGGRWVPRRALDEAYVALGERAYFPFRRARNRLREREAWFHSSLTQFYLTAAREAGLPTSLRYSRLPPLPPPSLPPRSG